jgi:hypothetical protein
LHVKSELLKVRELYEQIFDEIEGERDDADLRVYWPKQDSICYPKFVTIKEFHRLKQQNLKETENTSKIEDEEKLILKSLKTNNQVITKSSVMKFVPEREDQNDQESLKQTGLNESDVLNTTKMNSLLSLNYEDIEKTSALDLNTLKRMPKTDLISVRENLSLEVLWIQQAIQSRIQVCLNVFPQL